MPTTIKLALASSKYRRDFIRGGHTNMRVIFGGRNDRRGPDSYPDRYIDRGCGDCGYGGYGWGGDDWYREEAKRQAECEREEAKRRAE